MQDVQTRLTTNLCQKKKIFKEEEKKRLTKVVRSRLSI